MSDVIDVVLETTVIEVVQDGLVVEVAEEPVAIEIVGGGLELAAEIIAALNAANAPCAENAFATLDDVTTASAAEIAAHVAADDPHDDRANTTSQISTHNLDVTSHYLNQGIIDGLLNPENPPTDTNPFATRLDATEIAAQGISDHVSATDPHGDRAFASGLAANYDAAGAASTAVANHTSAVDPHGDRANTTSQIATHAGAVDPHGDRANTTSQIATHAGNHTAHGAIVHADVAPVLGAVSGDPTGFTSPENVIVTYDSTARTIALTGTVVAYYKGTLVTALVSGWVSTPHSDVAGRYYLYYNGSAFVWSTTEWTLDMIQIAAVYYGATHRFALRECHGLLAWQAHELFHHAIGTFREGGGTLSSYKLASTTAANRRPNVAATVLHDEDNITTNPALTSKVYTQLYLTLTGTATHVLSAAEMVPVLVNNPYYNRWDGAAWIQTLMASNSYMCVWLVAIPVTADAGSQAYRYQWLQGQSNGTLTTQQALTPADLNLGTLQDEAAEFVFLAKVIIQYTGGNWRLTSVTDLLGNKYTQVGAPAGAFLAAVATDETLTGDGTTGDPLSISTHAADSGAHRNYARIMMMGV